MAKQIDLYRYSDKYEPSKRCSGVYHDEENKVAVVTDKVILITDKSQYQPELAGKIIDRKGNEVTPTTARKFFNYQPLLEVEKKEIPINWKEIEAAVKRCIELKKETPHVSFAIQIGSAMYLMRYVKFLLKHFKKQKVYQSISKDEGRAIIYSENGNAQVIIGPQKYTKYKQYEGIIYV